MRLLKMIAANLVAIVCVLAIQFTLVILAHDFERPFMAVTGLLLTGLGVWFVFWPRSVIAWSRKNQEWVERWRKKYPGFVEGLEKFPEGELGSHAKEGQEEYWRHPGWLRSWAYRSC